MIKMNTIIGTLTLEKCNRRFKFYFSFGKKPPSTNVYKLFCDGNCGFGNWNQQTVKRDHHLQY